MRRTAGTEAGQKQTFDANHNYLWTEDGLKMRPDIMVVGIAKDDLNEKQSRVMKKSKAKENITIVEVEKVADLRKAGRFKG